MQTINFEQFKEIAGRFLNGEVPEKPIMIIPDSYRGRSELMEYTPANVKEVDFPTISNRPAFTSKTKIPFIYCTDNPMEDRIEELSGMFDVICLTTESFPEGEYYINEAQSLYNKVLEDIMDLLRRKGENNYAPFKMGIKCVSDIDLYNSDKDSQIITVTGATYLPTGLHLRVGQEIDGYKWVYYDDYMNAMPLIYLSVVNNIDSAIPYEKADD